MPTTKRSSKTTPRSKKGALAPGFIARKEMEVATKRARLAAAAREDIDLVKRLKISIEDAFYEMGEALVRLHDPDVFHSAGFDSFELLCKTEFKITDESARSLMNVVKRTTRSFAVNTGQTRTEALISLADAIAKNKTPMDLARARLRLPSGTQFDVQTATPIQIFDAAKKFRSAAPARGRGRHLDRDSIHSAAKLEAALHLVGEKSAKVTALAGLGRAPARFRIEVQSWDALEVLHKVLGKVLATKK